MQPIALVVFKHRLSGCPCACPAHVGRGLSRLDTVACLTCEQRAKSEGLEITIVAVDTIQASGLSSGSVVRYDGRTLSVEYIEQIFKLNGAMATPYARVAMKPIDLSEDDI